MLSCKSEGSPAALCPAVGMPVMETLIFSVFSLKMLPVNRMSSFHLPTDCCWEEYISSEYLVIFLLLGCPRCFAIQSCFGVYHRLNGRCGYTSTANWRAHSGSKQQQFFKEKTKQNKKLEAHSPWAGGVESWPRIWEMLCAFQCVLVRRLSFPGTTTVPLSHFTRTISLANSLRLLS